ncbi:MAG: respiratory nitrate reductase subunit gamma [Dehalococcoidia bacterium]|nr:respiratory nitrate reductase subunit gamma [Dehalococcoidia bacterium]
MNYLLFFIEGVLPYIAIIVFVLGTAYRLWRWLATPVPLRITMAPARMTWKGVAGKITAEVLLFISLLRSDRFLWVIAWTMHVFAIVVLVGTHFFGVIEHGIDLWTPYTVPAGKAIIYVAASFAFPLIITLLVLLFKRILTRDIRRISIPTDYVAIGLVLAHVMNGTYMSFFMEVDMAEVMKWGLGLMTLQPHVVEGSWLFALHTATAFSLFIYFPFSKLFHPLGQITNRWTMTQKEEKLIAGGSVVK